VWDAFQDAGVAPQLLYARFNIPRFIKFYSGRGRWALLDDLASTSAPPGQAELGTPSQLVPHGPHVTPPQLTGQGPGVPRANIERAVRDAAAVVLGSDALEGTP
jgi:hypothetical protein